jgi:hypothetical protein
MLICMPLFACLPVALLFEGAIREVLIAVGLAGLGAGGLLTASYGAFIKHLPIDPLGRIPASPRNSPSLFWVTVLLIASSSALALFGGLAGLAANYSRFIGHG